MAIYKVKNVKLNGSSKTKEELRKQKGKNNKIWYFSISYTDGLRKRKRYRSKNFTTKDETKKAELEFYASLDNKTSDISFETLFELYMKQKNEEIKEATYYCKMNRASLHILPYFKDIKIKDIAMNSVLEWKNRINKLKNRNTREHYKLNYKQSLFFELQSILEYGKRFHKLNDNHAKNVGPFKNKNDKVVSDEEKLRYIKPDEYKLLESVIDVLLWKTFFAFLYYTGCRKGEAQALKWHDFNFEKETVQIIKTLQNKSKNGGIIINNTKNRKNRTIIIPTPLMNLLKEYYKYENKIEGFNNGLYVFGNIKHLASTTIDRKRKHYYDIIDKKFTNQKFNRITNHEFRHSHASLLISKGINIDEIAFRLGDTANVVRKVYAHLFPETQEKVKKLLDEI